jgi:hypothetical protein
MEEQKKKLKLNTYQCPKCKDFVYSRARHDCRSCTCGAIFVDGGFEYTRIGFSEEVGPPKPYTKYINVTKEKLFADWNEGYDRYGIIKENGTCSSI